MTVSFRHCTRQSLELFEQFITALTSEECPRTRTTSSGILVAPPASPRTEQPRRFGARLRCSRPSARRVPFAPPAQHAQGQSPRPLESRPSRQGALWCTPASRSDAMARLEVAPEKKPKRRPKGYDNQPGGNGNVLSVKVALPAPANPRPRAPGSPTSPSRSSASSFLAELRLRPAMHPRRDPPTP